MDYLLDIRSNTVMDTVIFIEDLTNQTITATNALTASVQS